MPHIIIEYSGNLRERVNLPALIDRVHEVALDTGVFPLGGLRTRAAECVYYRIADGHPDNTFIHVTMRIGHGRDAATKHRASQAVFDSVCDFLRPTFERIPLGISLEVVEIDPILNFKMNNLHDYVKARAA